MIKNIVFDMGGVIIDYSLSDKAASAALNKEEYDFLLNNVYYSFEWIQADRGIYTLEEAMKNCKKRLKELTDDQIKRVVQTAHSIMPEIEGMYELISELKEKGYKIYLLSNAAKGYEKYTKRERIFSLFDKLFYSCDYHMVKPEREIYKKFLEVCKLKKEECVFIDDMPNNVEGAIFSGMSGIVFKKSSIILRKNLVDLGVNIKI